MRDRCCFNVHLPAFGASDEDLLDCLTRGEIQNIICVLFAYGFCDVCLSFAVWYKKLTLFHGDYVSTDNKVYFKSKLVKNVDIKTFKVTNKSKNGFYFAYDKNKFYYKDLTITKKIFYEI